MEEDVKFYILNCSCTSDTVRTTYHLMVEEQEKKDKERKNIIKRQLQLQKQQKQQKQLKKKNKPTDKKSINYSNKGEPLVNKNKKTTTKKTTTVKVTQSSPSSLKKTSTKTSTTVKNKKIKKKDEQVAIVFKKQRRRRNTDIEMVDLFASNEINYPLEKQTPFLKSHKDYMEKEIKNNIENNSTKILMKYDSWLDIYLGQMRSSIPNPKVLKQYLSFSQEVYGEAKPKLVKQWIQLGLIKSTDVFCDIGCGIGNVLFQVASMVGCRVIGVEIRKDLFDISQNMLEIYKQRSIDMGLDPCTRQIEIYNCDVKGSLDFNFSEPTVFFMHNTCFGPDLELTIMEMFKKHSKQSTKVLALKSLCPRFKPSDKIRKPWGIFKYPFESFEMHEGSLSWKSASKCSFYLFTIDDKINFTPNLILNNSDNNSDNNNNNSDNNNNNNNNNNNDNDNSNRSNILENNNNNDNHSIII